MWILNPYLNPYPNPDPDPNPNPKSNPNPNPNQVPNDFSAYHQWHGGTAFPIEISVPHTGTYEVALVDRRGADEFQWSPEMPCKSHRVDGRGATDSFYICTRDPRNGTDFGKGSGRYSGPARSWRDEHCTTYHCCGRSEPNPNPNPNPILTLTLTLTTAAAGRSLILTLILTLTLTLTTAAAGRSRSTWCRARTRSG